MASESLYSLEYEKSLLSGLLQFPDAFGDVAGHLKPSDFSKINGAVYAAICAHLSKNQTVSAVILGENLKASGVMFEDIEPYDYLKSLELIPVRKDEVEKLGKEVKKLSILRDYEGSCTEIRSELPRMKEKSFDEITSFIDGKLSGVGTSYHKESEVDIFAGMEALVEERAKNPVKPEDIGFAGPFPTWNRILGNCFTTPGALCLIGARTGAKKSSLGFFYNVYLAEKYDLPILHLDAGEMTPDEIRFRATCCLSAGRVPLHLVESGQWVNNKEYAAIIRGDIWPRVKKLKMTYINVGSMGLRELVTLVRRFYYRKVGRSEGKQLLINLDYIKGAIPSGKNVQEYQELGLGMAEFKTLITDEILASAWTSVQNNRMGVVGGSARQTNDSEEVLSLSDRLLHQATVSMVMRGKTPEELSRERGEFGDIRLTCIKHRRLLGPDFEHQLTPVLMPDGTYQKNYFSLASRSFHFEDRWDLRTMIERMGESALPVGAAVRQGTLI